MEKENEKRLLQITNLLSPFIAGIIIAFSNVDSSTVFGDTTSKILSPAGFTFAIWGPIFIFQAMFYLYQARDLLKPPEERIEMPYVHEVSVFFLLTWISTSLWYVLWGSGFVWPGIAAMFAYLITSLCAYLRLGINKRERTLREHLFVTVAWSMLTGWITVAAIVNTSTGFVLSGFDTGVLGEVGWTNLVLLIALAIYLLVLFTRDDFVFAGVGAWALIGSLATLVDPLNPPQPLVTLVVIIGLSVLVLCMIFWFAFRTKQGKINLIDKLRSS